MLEVAIRSGTPDVAESSSRHEVLTPDPTVAAEQLGSSDRFLHAFDRFVARRRAEKEFFEVQKRRKEEFLEEQERIAREDAGTPDSWRVLKPDLLERLQDPDPHQRETALRDVGSAAPASVGKPAVLSRVAKSLEDPVAYVRFAAADVMCQVAEVGDERAVTSVIQRLHHELPGVRFVAMDVLGRLAERGDELAIAAAATVLDDLARVDPAEDVSYEYELKGVPIDDERQPMYRVVAASVLGRLAARDDSRAATRVARRSAACVLCKLLQQVTDDPSHEELHAIIGFRPSDVRLAAIRALSEVVELGDEQAVRALEVCGRDPMSSVRRASMAAWPFVTERGDPRAMGPLISGFRDAEASVREAAVQALGQVAAGVGDPQGLQLLSAALTASESVEAHAQAAAIEAMPSVFPPLDAGAASLLVDASRRQAALVRCTALQVLPHLAARGDPRVVDAVLERLADEDALVREEALRTLGRLANTGDGQVVDKMVKRLRDPVRSVQEAARRGLEQLAG